MIVENLINNTIMTALFFWYNKKIFKFTKPNFIYYVLLALLVVIKSILNLPQVMTLNLLVTVITYLIVAFLFFNGSIVKKTLFIGFFFIASFVSEMNTFLLLNSLFNYYHLSPESLMNEIIGSGLSFFILLSILYFLTKFISIKDLMDSKKSWYLILLPIMSMLIIFSIVNSELLYDYPILCIEITLGIIICNLIACFVFSDLLKSKNIQLENEKFKLQQVHYRLMEEKFDNSKRFIHDFKKHINIINAYINNNEYSKLKTYMNEMVEEIQKEGALVVTGNQLIDLVLNSYKENLIKHSIIIRHEVKISDVAPITAFDFNVVFSNIIENALESCAKCERKHIKIKLDKKNNLIVLKVINSCNYANSNFHTVKQNKEYHGYGIKNIKRIASKYNGVAEFNFESEKQLFISTVIFNV